MEQNKSSHRDISQQVTPVRQDANNAELIRLPNGGQLQLNKDLHNADKDKVRVEAVVYHTDKAGTECMKRQSGMSACRITLSVEEGSTEDVTDIVENVAGAAAADACGVTSSYFWRQLSHGCLSPRDAERVTERVTETGQRVIMRPRCSSVPTFRSYSGILEVGEAQGALISNAPLPAHFMARGQVRGMPRQRRSISTDRLYLEPIEEEHGGQAHQQLHSHLRHQPCLLSVSLTHMRRYSDPNTSITE